MSNKCVECGSHVPVYAKFFCEECWTKIHSEGERQVARIAVDIDGVIASKLENGIYPDDYVKKKPLEKAKESLEILKAGGHFVYLFTARYEEDREVTENWLAEHGFSGLYNELVMAKPKYDILIDDRALRHTSWDSTLQALGEIQSTGRWY